MKKAALLLASLLWAAIGLSQTSVLTHHYNIYRQGGNIHEKILIPANVGTPDRFARLFVQPVDGEVYSQPLYMPDVTMGPHSPQAGRKHNVVFVATQGDMVYAFDAEDRDGHNAAPLWKANMLDPARGAAVGATTVPRGDVAWCHDINPQIGITSTPVIDPSSQTMYVVAKSKEIVSGVAHYIFRLHALSITNGAERPNSPVVLGDTTDINGSFTNTTSISVPGTGDGSNGGNLQFNVMRENQRVGLLLSKGFVYIAAGSHCDSRPFHGWIVAYNAQTLAQTAVFCTTPNGYDGGIWMEGAGLAADEFGNLLVAIANGTFDTTLNSQGFPSNQDYGDSIVKLDPNLNVVDYFTPFNQDKMFQPPPNSDPDADLGSGGVLLIPEQAGPHFHLLTQAGKLGTIYLVDRDHMGHFCSGCTADTNIVQEIPNGVANTPVPIWWDGSVYVRGDADVLKAFSLRNGALSTPPRQTNPATDLYSGRVTISSNGNADGIVWSLKTDGAGSGASAVLNAYDAVSLSKLYASDRNPNDNPGQAVPFTSPIVANGRVYVGAENQLAFFGLDTVRVRIINAHRVGVSWCFVVSAVDTANGRPAQGTIFVNGNRVGSTNQQLCLPLSTCPTGRCLATIEFNSFPSKQIRVP
jgi:hypothetical protein